MPDEPILQLAPHEIPLRRRIDMDEKPLLFEANCFGRIREFIGQSINEDGYGNALFFQLRDEPQRGSFVYSGDENSAQLYKMWGEPGTVETLKKCVESNLWGRYFVLDSSLNLATAENRYNTLFLNWNGLGMFHRNGGGFARFRWNQPCAEEMWNLTIDELLAQFIRRIQEPESEPQFAVWWAELSDAEKFDLIFPLATENYQEWQNICRLLPTALVEWPDNLNKKLYARFGVSGEVKANFFEKSGRASYQLIESPALQRLSRWLHEYFSPQRNDELCERYLCARQWSENTRSVCEVRSDQFTQHERLEALLQLREWLRDKAKPSEIEALLRIE